MKNPLKTADPLWLALLALALVVLAAVALLPGPRNDDQDEYCRMVAAHKQDPATGWPDFHHTYDTECTGDRAK